MSLGRKSACCVKTGIVRVRHVVGSVFKDGGTGCWKADCGGLGYGGRENECAWGEQEVGVDAEIRGVVVAVGERVI